MTGGGGPDEAAAGRSRLTAGSAIAMSLSWALITAAAHVVILGLRHHVLHGFTETAPQFVWVAPISYAVLYLALGAALWLASRVTPMVSRGVATGLFATVSAFALLLLVRRVHPLAWLLLAAGAGVQAGRLAGVWDERWRRMLRRAATASLVGLAASAAWKSWAPRFVEWRALSAPRSAAAAAPNVILLILDTVRARNLGLYGYGRPTSPAIDSLGAEGAVFEWAIAPAAWTLSSHASMLTGRWAHETLASYRRGADESLPNLAGALRDRGYLTAAFMANAGWAGHESGFTRGFLRYESHPLSLSQFLWSPSVTQLPISREVIGGLASRSPGRIVAAIRDFEFRIDKPPVPRTRKADEIATRFRAWRQAVAGRHPYFAMVNVLDAHDPYDPPQPFRSRFAGGRKPVDRYDGAIAYIDSIVGALATELRTTGELQRTLLVITADHGESFGEKGLRGHGESVYQPVAHVPLLVRYPGHVSAGLRRADAVSLRDMAATILHLVDDRPAHDLPGHSLFDSARPGADAEPLRILVSTAVNKPEQPNANGPIFGVMTDSLKYIRFVGSGAEELYRWRADTAEVSNVAGAAGMRAALDALRGVARGMEHR